MGMLMLKNIIYGDWWSVQKAVILQSEKLNQ